MKGHTYTKQTTPVSKVHHGSAFDIVNIVAPCIAQYKRHKNEQIRATMLNKDQPHLRRKVRATMPRGKAQYYDNVSPSTRK